MTSIERLGQTAAEYRGDYGSITPQFLRRVSTHGQGLSVTPMESTTNSRSQGCDLQLFSYNAIFSYIGISHTLGNPMSPTKRLIISDTSQFEKLAFDTFNKEQGLFAPLEIQKAKKGAPGRAGSSGSVQIAWHGRAVKFLVQLKSRTAPNIVQEAFWSLNKIAAKDRENFLLVVPFITPRIREMSEEAGVSCIDLSGNYFIQRREFLAVRLDHKNRFPESTPIKKIFTGASSQVGRLFLTEKRVYTSVNEVHEAIGQLGGALSLSAVSKVLKGLADELLIEKSSRRIVLLQAERLLDRLQTAYIPPNTLSTLSPANSMDSSGC
jgi:hypothetical protein